MYKIKNSYTFLQKLQILCWLIRTKIVCKNARLVRFPISIRGRQFIRFGNGLTTGINCRLEAFALSNNTPKLIFGNNIQINDNVHINAMERIIIGDDTLIASHVYISDNSHGDYTSKMDSSTPDEIPIQRQYVIKPVTIGSKVWIGEGAIIMPGVSIGNSAVIGAHSVVKHSIPPNCIVAGAPAKIIKKYDSSRQGWFKTDDKANFIE